MNKLAENEWLEDFNKFINCESAHVPESLSESIIARVRKDLNPSGLRVFAKLFSIHVIVGTLSLAICNQFGLSPFNSGFSLSDYFMTFGHSVCMFLCGVLFAGLTIVAAKLFLRPEELKVLKKNAILEVFGLSGISLGVFAALGAEIAFAIGTLWFIGSMIGGLGLTMLTMRTQHQA